MKKQDKLAAPATPREAFWNEFKTHMVFYDVKIIFYLFDGKIRNKPATKTALGIASNAMEKIEEQSVELDANQAAIN